MADDTKQTVEEFLSTARERLAKGQEAMSDDDKLAQEDLEFAYKPGCQWEDAIRRKRQANQRPCLEYNKMPSFVARVKNAMRMNRYSIRVRPKDGDADKQIADLMSGMIRSIEQTCDFEEAQDTGGQLSASCGRGWMRVETRYVSDESFDQEAYIMALTDAFAVVWDPSARQSDLQDAEWVHVYEKMSKDRFESKYPDATPLDVSVHTGKWMSHWSEGETVTVSDYFYRGEEKTKTLKKVKVLEQSGQVYVTDVFEDDLKELEKSGALVTPVVDADGKEMTRKVKHRPWMRCKMSGIELLEDRKEWIGTLHPIVPIWGERIEIDGKMMTWGLVRHGKDAIRSRNYSRTAMIERVALEPKAPWLAGKNQVAGLEDAYRRSRTDNVDLLTYNDDPGETNALAPPQRVFPEAASQAAITVAQADDVDLHDIVGVPWTATKPGPEKSGVAIAQRRIEGDVATYVYPDEMAKSIKRVGRILVDLMPKVYDSARLVRTRGLDNSEAMVPINASERMFPDDYRGPRVEGPTNGAEVPVFNDLSRGSYDVVVDVGPQFVTLRDEMLQRMEGFISKYPAAFPLIADLLAKLQDIPEAEIFEKRLKSLVPPHLLEPEEGEEEVPQPPQQPDPKLIEVLNKMEIATREQDRKEFQTILDGIKKLMEAEAIREGIQLPGLIAMIDQLMAQYMPQEPQGPPQGALPPQGGPMQ